MKFYVRYLVLNFLAILSLGFPLNQPHKLKQYRVNYKIIKKNISRNVINRLRVVSRNQDEIVDRSVSLFYDNMLTDLLGIAKLYNLINDETQSYFYIVGYEFAWFAFKVLKNNVNDMKFDMETEESQILFEQLIINVILYVGIKNIIFKNIFHIISN